MKTEAIQEIRDGVGPCHYSDTGYAFHRPDGACTCRPAPPPVATTIGPNCIQTYTGREFNPFDPDPAQIDILDIAHALSLQCRFGGHVRKRWTVAQHSILVACLCTRTPKLRLAALLHDAAEAYLIDLPRPIKHHPDMLPYRDMETNIEACIALRFNLDMGMHPAIKRADAVVLAAEARALKHGSGRWDRHYLGMVDVPESELAELAFVIRRANPPNDEYVRDEFLTMFREYGGKA